jgi:single-strand DNA-binding protein
VLNNVVLAGRLAADMETRTTQGGTTIGRFTLAVGRPKHKDREQETDWIECVLFGKTAEGLANHLTKGKPIAVIGSIQTRTWEDSEGKRRKAVEVKVDQVRFLPDGGRKQPQGGAQDSSEEDWPF